MYQRAVLDNGLRVLTAEMPHTRSVAMFIAVGAGSRYEAAQQAGISHFLEHLPFKGTRRWPTALAISEAVEGVGGMMNAATDREMTSFWCKVASVHGDRALPVLLDLVRHPLLEAAEMEKEREVILDELRMTNDYPAQVCELLLDRALWPAQAMGRDVGGTPESVAAISRDEVRDYLGRQYRPNNTVIGIAGDGMSSRLFQKLREELGITYDVHSGMSSYRDCGALIISCGVEPGRATDAIAAVRRELRGLLEMAPESEVHKAKEYIKGRLLMRMEDSRAVAAWLASSELLTGEVPTPEETAVAIDAVTPAEVRRAAERIIAPGGLRLAAVGPRVDAGAFADALVG